jgi:hypothetical protein
MRYITITGNELEQYYELDAEALDMIKSGEKTAAVICITDNGGVQHALMEKVPDNQTIANINMWEEDDTENAMQLLREWGFVVKLEDLPDELESFVMAGDFYSFDDNEYIRDIENEHVDKGMIEDQKTYKESGEL